MISVLPGSSDTIVAQSTVGARSALAVIRLSGPDAHRIAGQLLTPWRPIPARTAFLATMRDHDRTHVIDRGIVTVYHAPSSYTGEDMVELSLHGGEVGPALALSAFLAAGARHALPGEFTKRAMLNGKIDLLQAEAIADLIEAPSRAMHDAAMGQLAGHLSAWLNALREQIIEIEALLAYDVDFPEEDDGPIASERIINAASGILATMDALLATAPTGELLRTGAIVVIAGAPNAGKSSLFNALIGMQRAIVTDIPGTTRDALEAMVDIGPWPVRLVDTAGLREGRETVERLGIEIAEQHVANAHVVLVCGEDETSLVQAVERVNALTSARTIAIGTKSDRSDAPLHSPAALNGASYVSVSARTGAGLPELLKEIADILGSTRAPLSADNPVLTRERHRLALTRARAEVAAFVEAWAAVERIPAVVSAVHLYAARGHLDELIGVLDLEDVLDRVFSTFCVGK
jgi:tRNA modification GTPase